MLELIFALVCVLLIGYLVLLLRSYEYMSVRELKRQARKGNVKAQKVYAVRGVYGSYVFVLIWSLIGALTATMVVLLERQLWSGVAIVVSLPVTVLVHAILPWSRYPSPSLGMAAAASPVIVKILSVTRPLFRVLEKLTGRWVAHGDVGRIHSKEELLDLLMRSEIDGDSVSKDEFNIAAHALTFGDKLITEVMTPKSMVRMIKADEVLSPVTLGELHESGFSRFPVIDSVSGGIVGTLYMKDAVEIHTNKLVRDVMRSDVYFVNEFTSLDHVLNAFIRTKHHLFLVVNEFEEVTGVITIEDVIEQILGRRIVDEFDQYADLRAVASTRAKKERSASQESHI